MSNKKIDDINFDYLEENSFLLLDSLIPEHLLVETNSIEFLPNIYPLNFLGRFLEQLDYYAPSISMGLIHIRNIFIGK